METRTPSTARAASAAVAVDAGAVERMDAIIHLSGENISTGLSGPLAPLGIQAWSDAKKKEIEAAEAELKTFLSFNLDSFGIELKAY